MYAVYREAVRFDKGIKTVRKKKLDAFRNATVYAEDHSPVDEANASHLKKLCYVSLF